MTRLQSEAVLRQIVVDVQHSEPPEVDWDKLETRLVASVERRAAPNRRSGARSKLSWLLAALVFGVLGLALVELRRAPGSDDQKSLAAERAAPAEASAPTDGEKLEVGQRIVATAQPVTIRHRGLAEWVLAPGSAGEVKALDPTVVIQLQSGSLSANVTPSARSESFIVEAGGLRVSVRGTVFSVERVGEQVVVDVKEGTVAVGQPGKSSETLLVGPASGRFLSTGERAGTALRTQGRVSRRGAPNPPDATAPAPPASISATAAGLQQEPTFEDVERGLSMVEASLADCLGRHTDQGDTIKLSLRTRVTLKVEPDGSLSRHRFLPPLAPSIAGCFAAEASQMSFAPSLTGAHIIRDLEIAR